MHLAKNSPLGQHAGSPKAYAFVPCAPRRHLGSRALFVFMHLWATGPPGRSNTICFHMLSLEAPKLCAVLKRWRRLGGARCFQTLLCSETSGAYSCVACASSTACVRACAGACTFACARACLGGAQGFPKPCALVRRWCFYKALVPLGLRMVLNPMFSQGAGSSAAPGGLQKFVFSKTFNASGPLGS